MSVDPRACPVCIGSAKLAVTLKEIKEEKRVPVEGLLALIEAANVYGMCTGVMSGLFVRQALCENHRDRFDAALADQEEQIERAAEAERPS